MRLRLIANPYASGVTRSLVDAVARRLSEVAEIELRLTERARHAIELARESEADVVVAMGGDGTVNEVVNGILPGAAMAVVPGGATSVFARTGPPPKDADGGRAER